MRDGARTTVSATYLARSNSGGSQNFAHAAWHARLTDPSPISTPCSSPATVSKNAERSAGGSSPAVCMTASSWRSVKRIGDIDRKVVGVTAVVKWWRRAPDVACAFPRGGR
jgi:hypothetical protein